MPRMRTMAGFILALWTVGLISPAALANSIGGTVRDEGKNPPNGISGVMVQVRDGKGNLLDPKATTNTDGEFTLKDVPAGSYTIVLNKVGYVPHPDESKKLTVANDPEDAGDLLLMQAYASADTAAAYYGVVASVIVKKASAAGDEKGKVYAEECRRLLVINLPPSSKALVMVGMNKEDDTAERYVPMMKAYLAAKPDNIRKAEALFSMSLMGKTGVPSTEDMNNLEISPQIVADIALMMARNASVPEDMRMAFVKEFMGKWYDTEAATLFTGYQKEGLDTVPSHLPFKK